MSPLLTLVRPRAAKLSSAELQLWSATKQLGARSNGIAAGWLHQMPFAIVNFVISSMIAFCFAPRTFRSPFDNHLFFLPPFSS